MNQAYTDPIITTTEFLRATLPEPEGDERIELRCIALSKAVTQRWARSAEEFVEIARTFRADHHLFFGAALRAGECGDAAHVSRYQALRADVDFDRYGDGASGAWQAVGSFPLRASVVVSTGNGLHGYWLLTEPHDRDDEGRARAVMRGIARVLGEGATRPLDPVDDLPRVMRLPGSWNLKGGERKPVTVARFDPDRRYDLSDFIDLGIEASAPASGGGAPGSERSPLVVARGGRNRTLARFGGLLRRYGLGAPAIAEALAAINRHHCVPPLPDGEVAAIARSVARYPPAGVPEKSSPPSHSVVVEVR